MPQAREPPPCPARALLLPQRRPLQRRRLRLLPRLRNLLNQQRLPPEPEAPLRDRFPPHNRR